MTFDEFVNEIMEYESDTFTASGFELTREEAVKMAENILQAFVDNRLDGVILDYHLADIRGL